MQIISTIISICNPERILSPERIHNPERIRNPEQIRKIVEDDEKVLSMGGTISLFKEEEPASANDFRLLTVLQPF